ncbi:thioesterase-like superfamily-domain-containing protein [Cladorrhinum samala]|uniref:Thioesterase-like superfamily-domain-containing protein n=1 Tax=Cladorrhinum samala TaxID=585594 RepID=A0AAV9HQ71_9PEZI|nr:thioesterase-like superfamily-domain-containing protein [Cladorrhinum samala]
MSDSDLVPFSEAIKIVKLDSHTYKANLIDSYCIGAVPNGGYTASCLLEATRLHLGSKQPDPMTAHFQFLNRAEVGPAVIVISDVKFGRQFSTVHLTLHQGALLPQAPWFTQASTRAAITAYVTVTDLSKESGLTLPTLWGLSPQPPAAAPAPDFGLLKHGKDPNWTRSTWGLTGNGKTATFARVLRNYDVFLPKAGQVHESVTDLWMRFNVGGGRFTNSSLAFVADAFPFVVEAYRPAKGSDKPYGSGEMFWYPTVVMSLEVKRALPERGVEWLRLRMHAKEIRNGRLDLEVLILGESGELVGISHQVNLVLGSERNTKGREKGKI